MPRFNALFMIAAVALSLQSAMAQKFKVGERVEFDRIQSSDPARAQWAPGTVLRIDVVRLSSTLSQTNYVIRIDPTPGRLPEDVTISQRLAEQGMTYSGDSSRSVGFVRAAAGGGTPAPAIQTDTLRLDQFGTVLADRPLLDCRNLKTGPARNGQQPPPELMKTIIRCLFEQPSAPGQDGATTIDITAFTPGASHRWDIFTDRGSGATIDTISYTFQVTFNQKTFYHTYNQAENGIQRIFSCYVDEDVHGWYCGQFRALREGERKMIPVDKK